MNAPYAPEYPVRTERLALRPLVESDLDAVHAYQSLADVVRFVPYEPRTREEVLERVTPPKNSSTIEKEGDALLLAVVLRETDELIGDVMLRYDSEANQTAQIGYVFNPQYAGHGYATEVAQALLRMAFDGLGARRAVAHADARNTASLAVLRRVGMWQEAHFVQNEFFKGEWTDQIDFGLLADEWRSRESGESTGEVGEQVVDVLDTDGQPHE